MLKLISYLSSQNQSREFGNFETFFKFSQLFSRKLEREQSILRGLKNQNEKMTRTVFYGYFEKCRKTAGKLMCLGVTLVQVFPTCLFLRTTKTYSKKNFTYHPMICVPPKDTSGPKVNSTNKVSAYYLQTVHIPVVVGVAQVGIC